MDASQVSSARAWLPDFSAVRTIEIAFSATESLPATKAWLLDAAVQANTSSVMPVR